MPAKPTFRFRDILPKGLYWRTLLIIVALCAAYVAGQKPADILFLVGAAFSFAAASFFPALVCGVFWKKASKLGAILGMSSGLAVTFYYMATTQPWLRGLFGVTAPVADMTWFGITPISAGIFGIPAGFLMVIVGSLIAPNTNKEVIELVDHVRYPSLTGDIDTKAT